MGRLDNTSGPDDRQAAPQVAPFLASPVNWLDDLAPRLIRRAALQVPGTLWVRLEEEWSAALSEQNGRIARLRFAVGCLWASMVIGRDQPSIGLAAIRTMECHLMHASAHPEFCRLSRRPAPSAGRALLCDINITPLIDVMLVLLVTLVITLPVVTHAVKLNMPTLQPRANQAPPEVIDLEIDFDGTLSWNGAAVGSFRQLEGFFRNEAVKVPQPEIHLRPDRRAKYDYVARVLASAQHSRLNTIGFVNTGEFSD